ncbi:prepilin-type N-terminal cleavage/methylation domain-containing protein [Acinetobacter nectaris]|uniref:prepilin-type N-terminal cleavage/methylation domain-containing protein n=1 Tax=Acinetobacter nectaris TaxID=1219382 RepID=UPI0023517065|nr:prepilin-type N-terminal cleavage/methylation domain-containing protein [Acinetobacter nectaris]
MKQKGFTLLELMIVVVIVAILAAIAIPSYQSYVRRTNESMAMQEIQRIAVLLERYKTRNFSYQGFLVKPNNLNGYIISVQDQLGGNLGASNWAIQAKVSNGDVQQYSLLMTSSGLRCKNKETSASSNVVTFNSCGTGSENW